MQKISIAKMEQMQKNSEKSVILPHKHKVNNVPGRKAFFSQHSLGLFPWAHCKPTNADTGGPPMWHKHICRSVRREERNPNQNHSARKKNIHCFLTSYNASLISVWWLWKWMDVNRPQSGPSADLLLPGTQSNYRVDDIHKAQMLCNNGAQC